MDTIENTIYCTAQTVDDLIGVLTDFKNDSPGNGRALWRPVYNPDTMMCHIQITRPAVIITPS